MTTPSLASSTVALIRAYTDGQYFDVSVVEEIFLKRTAFMREKGSLIGIGEFGPVYRGEPERAAVTCCAGRSRPSCSLDCS